MNEWKETTLSSAVTSNNQSIGKNYEYETIQYLDTGSITNGKIEGYQEVAISEAPSRAKRLVKHEDIIYSTVRPVQRHFGFMTNPIDNLVVSTGFSVIEVNKELANPKFIYYFLSSDETVEILDVIAEASTTTYPSLKPKDIENLEILLPRLEEQKAIAEVLSSLDDKINLLHRQNKTLEELAQTLFRQWFIEEAKDEWETCKLEDIATMQNGFSFSSKHYVPYEKEHLEVLKMGHIERGGGLKSNPKKDFVPREEKLEKWVLNKNDIVMAMTDMKDNVVILGVPAIIDKSNKYVLNQRVARIYLKSNEKLLNNYLLYIQLKDPDFIALLQSKANSGVQVNLSTQSIKDSEIIIPPMSIQETVGNDITDLYLKKENNDIQIKTLENMRDTLLPKLMSGEVKIKLGDNND